MGDDDNDYRDFRRIASYTQTHSTLKNRSVALRVALCVGVAVSITFNGNAGRRGEKWLSNRGQKIVERSKIRRNENYGMTPEKAEPIYEMLLAKGKIEKTLPESDVFGFPVRRLGQVRFQWDSQACAWLQHHPEIARWNVNNETFCDKQNPPCCHSDESKVRYY